MKFTVLRTAGIMAPRAGNFQPPTSTVCAINSTYALLIGSNRLALFSVRGSNLPLLLNWLELKLRVFAFGDVPPGLD